VAIIPQLINLLRRCRDEPPARYTRVVEAAGREQLPDHLHPRRVYALGTPPKWAILECPCGRGHQIQLNLAHPGRAQWTLLTESQGPSLRPSIDVRDIRRCHFWLRNGTVHWA
jgi:hypothetical protein